MKLPMKMESPVTWKALLFILASFGAFVMTFSGLAVARAETAVERAKQESDAGMAEVRKDIQAVYNFLLTNQPQKRLEAGK